MDNNIITIVVIIGGIFAQAMYFKGSFTEKINNHTKEIDEMGCRLNEGQKTFSEIRENISVTTGSLKMISEELKNIRDNTVQKEVCEVTTKGFDQRMIRLEQKENSE